jgi:hypothetical protein
VTNTVKGAFVVFGRRMAQYQSLVNDRSFIRATEKLWENASAVSHAQRLIAFRVELGSLCRGLSRRSKAKSDTGVSQVKRETL